MRDLIFESLMADTELQDYVDSRIYEASALGVDDVPANPEKPYITYQELDSAAFPEVRETSQAQARIFQFFVYDERGSFTRIGDIIGVLRQTLSSLSGKSSTSGTRCTDAVFRGTSADVPDIQQNANVKFATFQFVSK